jgi:hypothetical protein
MLKHKSLTVAAIYALLFSALICFVFYRNHVNYITHAYFLGLLGLFPFVYIAVWLARSDRGEQISGRDAGKEGIRFVVMVTLLLVVFQIIFFEVSFKEYKINYMQTVGPEILKEQMISGKMKIVEADIPKIIATDVEGVTLFKEITSVIFKTFVFGGLSSLICAFLLKRIVEKA